MVNRNVGRLVVAKVPLVGDIPKGTIGIVLDVLETWPDGTPYTSPRFELFFSNGAHRIFERIGIVFDYVS